ncbi:MAG: class I tRNA ligase family protein, partial [Gemmatimonadota bacterium]
HLLYSRFVGMVLHDLGQLPFEEPFATFRAHGLIVKDGSKMSKSRGNVVIPDQYIDQWGADTFRMYLMFLGPFQEGGDFRDAGISGPRRFLDRVWDLVDQSLAAEQLKAVPRPVAVKYHQTVKKVTEDLASLSYNTAIAALMELLNTFREHQATDRSMVEGLVLMLAPLVPHFAEENWERLGHHGTVFDARWPQWDPTCLVLDEIEVVVQVNGKTRSKVLVGRTVGEAEVVAAALADEAVQRSIGAGTIRKRIYVPGRLLNLVIAAGGDA